MSFFDQLGLSKKLSFHRLDQTHFVPGRSETVRVGNVDLGYIGELDEAAMKLHELEGAFFAAEISLSRLSGLVPWTRAIKDIPRFPAIKRDLSVFVKDEVSVQDVMDYLSSLQEPLIKAVELFDLFRGGRIPKGFKNLGFRITYQSETKTLISSEIQTLHAAIAAKVASRFQASFQ